MCKENLTLKVKVKITSIQTCKDIKMLDKQFKFEDKSSKRLNVKKIKNNFGGFKANLTLKFSNSSETFM